MSLLERLIRRIEGASYKQSVNPIADYLASIRAGDSSLPVQAGRQRFDSTNQFRVKATILSKTDYAPGSGYRRRNGI